MGIESQEKWADEVGGTVTEVHTDRASGIIWRRREFGEKSNEEQSPARQKRGSNEIGSLYGGLLPKYDPYTPPASISSRTSSNGSITSLPLPLVVSHEKRLGVAKKNDDDDQYECCMFGHSDCVAAHGCFEVPRRQAMKAFRLSPLISDRIDAAIPQRSTNIHTDPVSIINKGNGPHAHTGQPANTSSQYERVNTPIMKSDSLLTRQIKTHGIPLDPFAAPAIAPAAPIFVQPAVARPRKAMAPKGYEIIHWEPEVIVEKAICVKRVAKEAKKGKDAGGNQACNKVTVSLPVERSEKQNEKTTPRNYSDPTNKTKVLTTVMEVEEDDGVA